MDGHHFSVHLDRDSTEVEGASIILFAPSCLCHPILRFEFLLFIQPQLQLDSRLLFPTGERLQVHGTSMSSAEVYLWNGWKAHPSSISHSTRPSL